MAKETEMVPLLLAIVKTLATRRIALEAPTDYVGMSAHVTMAQVGHSHPNPNQREPRPRQTQTQAKPNQTQTEPKPKPKPKPLPLPFATRDPLSVICRRAPCRSCRGRRAARGSTARRIGSAPPPRSRSRHHGRF